ncbi:hypothetical protein [Streptomyces sp. NBC_01276]|uniref:hypothetical protein n=1 Tax=Streptomyces sp. NBC_01276 TaxID=2903808 RepID=UPI00352DA45E
MIASTPVARWTWGRDTETADSVLSCITDLVAAYSVLADHRLAVGGTTVHLAVPEWGSPQSYLFEGDLTLSAGREEEQSAERLARQIQQALRPGRIGSVDAQAICSGMRDGKTGGLEKGMFLLGASAFDGFVTVELITYSDIWMSHDLKGRAQPTLHDANAPRLSAALRGLAEVLDSETDPEEPTYFAKATETGVENFFGSDGRASDVWASYEIPYRKRAFRNAPAFDAAYKRSAAGPVQCIPVSNAHEVVVGYAWASDGEGAASFEPRDAVGEEGIEAGHLWLERLGAAYERGLSPSQALAEFAGRTAGDEPWTLDLTALRELASEGPPGNHVRTVGD